MDVYGNDGQIVDDADILNGLKYITQNSTSPAAGVGYLTTESRNVWGVAYQEMRKGDCTITHNFLYIK